MSWGSPHGWFEPVTRDDYLSVPGVVAVEHGEEPGTAILHVKPGCEGIARILTNAQVTIIGLRLEERVVGAPAPEPEAKKPPARRRASTTRRSKT